MLILQLGPLVERLRVPDPAEVVEAAMQMGPEDAAALQSRWMMLAASTGLPSAQKPVWRPPTLQHLPQTHQVRRLCMMPRACSCDWTWHRRYSSKMQPLEMA